MDDKTFSLILKPKTQKEQYFLKNKKRMVSKRNINSNFCNKFGISSNPNKAVNSFNMTSNTNNIELNKSFEITEKSLIPSDKMLPVVILEKNPAIEQLISSTSSIKTLKLFNDHENQKPIASYHKKELIKNKINFIGIKKPSNVSKNAHLISKKLKITSSTSCFSKSGKFQPIVRVKQLKTTPRKTSSDNLKLMNTQPFPSKLTKPQIDNRLSPNVNFRMQKQKKYLRNNERPSCKKNLRHNISFSPSRSNTSESDISSAHVNKYLTASNKNSFEEFLEISHNNLEKSSSSSSSFISDKYSNPKNTTSKEYVTPSTSFTSNIQLNESNKSSSISEFITCSNLVHNSTETSIFSEDTMYVTNNSLSEYVPDSTNDKTISSECLNSENTSHQETQQSLQKITSPLNITKVTIPDSSKSKKHFCVFCKTLQTKLARHLLLKHKSEKQVKAILNLPKRSKERVKVINQLRKDGDFLHNTTKSLNTGILIVSRQQQRTLKNEVDDYICCKNCKAFFSKKTLRIHLRKCVNQKKNDRTNFVSGRRLTQYVHEEANEILKTKIFPILRNDKITSVIRYDELITKYGNKLAEKYTLTHQHDMIRSHLRLLGRFKIAIKELCPNIEDLKEIFKPPLFDSCVKALRKVANWDDSLMWFRTPAVAQQLTCLIKKCGYKQRTEFIKIQADDLKKDLDDFLLLWEEEIPTLINKKACEDQANQKRNKKIVLPSKEDIKKIYIFLKNKIINEMEVLNKEFCHYSWTELIKATLIFIQIFNRRRAGEIERLTLSNYQNKEKITDNVEDDILKTMSKDSLAFAKQFVRITIRGKLGRTVSVLLSPLCVSAIDLIIKYREAAGITTSNEYIFCKKVSSKLSKPYFRACPLLKKFSTECGAVIPESLRGTTLRKHIATYTSLLNIEEASVDKLANFMGHHKDIHKNVYRMSIPVAEITCVSKLLQNAIGDDDIDDDNDGDDETVHGFNEVQEDFEEVGLNSVEFNISNISDVTPKKKKKRSTSPFGKTKRSRWSEEEKEAIISNFGSLKDLEKLPSLSECINVINKCPALEKRTPQQLKTWIDNQRRYK